MKRTVRATLSDSESQTVLALLDREGIPYEKTRLGGERLLVSIPRGHETLIHRGTGIAKSRFWEE